MTYKKYIGANYEVIEVIVLLRTRLAPENYMDQVSFNVGIWTQFVQQEYITSLSCQYIKYITL